MSLEGRSDAAIKDLENRLLDTVRRNGGMAGNSSLIRELGWADDLYWSVRDSLVDSGDLIRGKGRGGSVRIAHTVESVESERVPRPDSEGTGLTEADLYEPLERVLRERWARDQKFEQYHVEITARQGRRDTGGTWTRPDLVVASLTKFLYVPEKHFDIVTFEVKDWSGLDVTAVYEALAHHRASTRSYVLAHIPNASLEDDYGKQYVTRIEEEAGRHGIGFIVAETPDDYDTWEERVEATHRAPSPHTLNDFITLQFSDEAKNKILTWFR